MRFQSMSVLLIGITLTALLGWSQPACGASAHEALLPLLVDLDGWSAEEAQGMSMDMGGMRMVNATRSYTQGDARLDAMLMAGDQSMAQAQVPEMNMETEDGRARVSQIDGFKVYSSYDSQDNSGGVVVFLGDGQSKGGVFTLSFQGLPDSQALEIARKFDWSAMKAAVAAVP